jgi:glycerophosphoryl diester phosphodiesterase
LASSCLNNKGFNANINYVGTEILFDTERAPLSSADYVEKLHADGKLAWINAIIYNYKAQLSGGHSDDLAISCDPEAGWGWLADRGYDIIQTDWPLSLRLFLEQTGRRYRKITPDKE